jgi:LysM repeat protein
LKVSRNRRISDKKSEQLINSFINANNKMKKSVAVLSTSLFMTSLIKPAQLVLAAEADKVTATTVQTYSTNPFLNAIIPSATLIAAQNNLYASVMMAQAVLESGWGTSTLASAPNYNLFGIKGDYNGETVNMNTLEDSGAQNYYQIQADFRKYPSYAESLQDYANLLKNGTSWNPNYYAGAWLSNAATYQDATAYLTGRYATDTAYNTKLNKIIEQYGLSQYDSGASLDNATTNTGTTTNTSTGNTTVAASNMVHIVQAGDTLYAIAKKYGVQLVDLMEVNKLNSSMIFVGNQLIIPKIVTVVEAPPASSETETPAEAPTVPETAAGTADPGNVVETPPVPGTATGTVDPGTVVATPPASSETETPVEAPAVPATETGIGSYTVVKGDTLWRIATANNMSLAELKEMNTLTADAIYPGQILKIKVAADTTTGTATQPTEVNKETQQTNPSASAGSYTVKAGDTLYKIATANGLTLSQLKERNSLTSDLILVGQTLSLGTAGTTVTEVIKDTNQTTTANTTATKSYTVTSGDTLWKIASSNGISVATLKSLNNLSSDNIYSGQVLTLNGTVSGQTTTPTVVTNTTTAASGAFIKPANGYISSPFGNRTDPFTGAVDFHRGLDIAGSGAISAAQSGTVEVAAYHYSYGNYVVINHGTINGVTVKTLYAHMQSGLLVKPGQTVSKGQQIGVMGTTGNSTGVHLHFEVQENGSVVNPLNYINGTTSTAVVPTTVSGTVTVASGDTLWKLASANGMSVAELKTLNNLTSDVLLPGQVLTLSKTVTNTPAATTPTTTPVSTNKATVTVASGDTLWKLASANGLSVTELKTLNNLTSDVILPGQTLTLNKTVTNTPAATTTPTTTPVSTNKATVTVATGDTLWKLASANGLSVTELKALNNLTSDVILPGQTLTLSGSATATQTATPASTPAPTTPVSTSKATVTVASGDTLWKLANANGLTVAELKALNNLTTDYVYPGQSLVLAKSAQTQTPAQTVTTVVAANTSADSIYTVQKGDTLYKIASANGISITELKTLNNLSSDIIFVNQTLKVKQAAAVTVAAAPATTSAEKTYTVKKGDTLYFIAKENGVSLAELIEANGITSDTIYIGQVINL